jgi:hypothetical protein
MKISFLRMDWSESKWSIRFIYKKCEIPTHYVEVTRNTQTHTNSHNRSNSPVFLSLPHLISTIPLSHHYYPSLSSFTLTDSLPLSHCSVSLSLSFSSRELTSLFSLPRPWLGVNPSLSVISPQDHSTPLSSVISCTLTQPLALSSFPLTTTSYTAVSSIIRRPTRDLAGSLHVTNTTLAPL